MSLREKIVVVIFITVIVILLIVGGFFLSREKRVDITAVSVPTTEVTASSLRASVITWEHAIKEVGAEEAYKRFIESASKDRVSAHQQAHAFGEALYNQLGIDGLKVCDSSFEFGCYHSFFGTAVEKEGITN